MSMFIRAVPVCAFLLTLMPLHAEPGTRLTPQTLTRFENYVHIVEAELVRRQEDGQEFLEINNDRSGREKVQAGEFLVRPEAGNGSVPIPGGLIHDWVGTTYIPNSSVQDVLAVLQDFDHHKDIYPEVIDSKLMQRSGDDLQGYWRLQQKAVVTVVLDVQQAAHYEQAGEGRWICRAYAREIAEIESAGTDHERRLSEGQNHGYLWRLYAYWSLQPYNGGVLAECRTISLSRNVPVMLNWVVKPLVHGVPRESLLSTLRDTRSAAVTRCDVTAGCKIRREPLDSHSVDSVRSRAGDRSSLLGTGAAGLSPVSR